MMLMSQKPISKTTSRAVNIIAAMASSILFCAIAQGAGAASIKTLVGGASGTVTSAPTTRAALQHEPLHTPHGGAHLGDIKGESIDDRHRDAD
jgi:hypothetical protein